MVKKNPVIREGTIAEFRPLEANPNQHTERGMHQLKQSVEEDGWVAPITVAADGESLDGAARTEVATDKSADSVVVVEHDGTKPVIMVRTDIPDASTPLARRIIYRANRIAELDLSWDGQQIAVDLEAGMDLDDMFSGDEIAAILEGAADALMPGDAPEPQVDRAAELNEQWQVERGQIWEIPSKATPGKCHRVMCGDSTSEADVERLMGGEEAGAIIADPPYGINLDTDYTSMNGPGAQIKSGGRYHTPVTGDDKLFDSSSVQGIDGALEQFWFGADYYLETLEDWQQGSWLVWDKRLDNDKAEMFGSHFELIWSRKKHKRRILRHLWAGVAHASGDDRKFVHPTTKSGHLIAELIKRWCKGLVYDPFLGSGTTIVASEQTGRLCYGCEIEPKYVAVTLQRLADMGLEPRLSA